MLCVWWGGGGARNILMRWLLVKVSKIFALTGGFEGVFACFPMYVFEFNVPPTTKVMWRRGNSL